MLRPTVVYAARYDRSNTRKRSRPPLRPFVVQTLEAPAITSDSDTRDST
jgi:hypothetical protein